MDFRFAGHTDEGRRHNGNQDAYSVQIADSVCGRMLLTVLCDGVGGFRCGERASSTAVANFSEWFVNCCSHIDEFNSETVSDTWNYLIENINAGIRNFGIAENFKTGTTLAVLLLVDSHAFMTSIGDSRIYKITDKKVMQLSKDHTLAQREYDAGRITSDQLTKDRRSHILLQCLGASEKLNVTFSDSDCDENDVFLLCTDGFYRRLKPEEFSVIAGEHSTESEKSMKNTLAVLTEITKERGETDNATVVAVKVLRDGDSVC